MGIAIANTNLTIQITPPTVTGTPQVITPPSTKVKADGSYVYKGPIDIFVPDLVLSGGFTPTPTTFTIQPTALKTKVEGSEVIRQNDFVTTPVTFPHPSSSPATVPVTVTIQDAGQMKVLSL